MMPSPDFGPHSIISNSTPSVLFSVVLKQLYVIPYNVELMRSSLLELVEGTPYAGTLMRITLLELSAEAAGTGGGNSVRRHTHADFTAGTFGRRTAFGPDAGTGGGNSVRRHTHAKFAAGRTVFRIRIVVATRDGYCVSATAPKECSQRDGEFFKVFVEHGLFPPILKSIRLIIFICS